MSEEKRYFKTYRRQAIRAAEELQYGEDVIKRLKKCENEIQIGNVMAKARKGE